MNINPNMENNTCPNSNTRGKVMLLEKVCFPAWGERNIAFLLKQIYRSLIVNFCFQESKNKVVRFSDRVRNWKFVPLRPGP